MSAIEQSHITGREIRSAAIVRPDARQPDLGRVLRWFTDREGRLKGWTPNQRAGGWGYACAPDGMRLEAIPAQPHRQGTPAVRGRAKWRPLSVQVAAGHRRPPAGHRLLGDGVLHSSPGSVSRRRHPQWAGGTECPTALRRGVRRGDTSAGGEL